MNDLDFEALKTLPDEELKRTVEKRLRILVRRFETIYDEGDLEYVRFISDKLREEQDGLEAIVLERLEQMMKRTMKKKKKSSSKPS
jgi:hypothetical protein